MPKLTLRLADRDLTECVVGEHPVSIGRLRDNTLVIDSPAVSARHARVSREGEQYLLEDLRSTNGTFVNDRAVARHTLADGDVITIAKHTILFTLKDAEPNGAIEPVTRGTESQVPEGIAAKTAIPTAQGRIGTIRVIAGNTDQPEYVLAAVTTMIGKAETSQIRLKGLFKPQVAAAIARKGEGFSITPMGGKVTVNGEPISGRRDLANGDRIDVSGLTLEFTLS